MLAHFRDEIDHQNLKTLKKLAPAPRCDGFINLLVMGEYIANARVPADIPGRYLKSVVHHMDSLGWKAICIDIQSVYHLEQ